MSCNTVLNAYVGARFGCESCNNVAVGLKQATLGWVRFCADHIDAQQYFILPVVTQYGFDVPAEVVPGDYMLYTGHPSDKRFLAAVATANFSAANAIYDLKTSLTTAATQMEDFKSHIVQTVVDWDGGCQSGKEEFLSELGLEWPSYDVTLTVTLQFCGNPNDISVTPIEDAIEDILNRVGGCANIDTEIDY